METGGRRSVRQRVCVPILLSYEGVWFPAQTGVISPNGILLLAPQDWPLDAELEVENPRSGASAKCRVAWQGGEERPGLFKLGLEFFEPQPDFWGKDYEPVEPPPPPPDIPATDA